MHTQKYTYFMRIIVFLLIITMCMPTCVHASEDTQLSPRASYYLTSYNTYIYPAALGKVQVWFTVTGVDYMDEIGVLTVRIYESTDNENWTWVETYKQASTEGMLAYDKIQHTGYVEFQGTIGRYYKAYVTIWAGKDGAGDTRYMWTQPKKATLLPG